MKTLPPDFEVALTKFVADAQALCDEHLKKNFPTLPREILTIDPGHRYVRIWKGREDESQRYAYCFVDITNGNVLKPATWKAPAKQPRGNIYTDAAKDCVTEYGAKYLR